MWVAAALSGAVAELALANHARYDAGYGARTIDRAMRLTIALCLGAPVIARLIPGWGSPAPAVIAGAVCTLAGLLIRAWAMRTLGRRYVLTPQAQSADHYLCSTGPYRYLRHPGYLGLLLQFLGMGAMLSPVVAIAASMPMIGVFVLRIHGEERILLREFGTDYRRYRDTVRWKLVPCVF